MNAIVNIDVPDLQRAIDFYTAAIECRLVRRLDADVAELACGSARIYLLEHRDGSGANVGSDHTRSYSRHWTPVHIDFVVANLEESIERATAAGAQRESAACAWRGSTHVTFADPFGHGFCLIAFRAGTYE